MNNNELIYYNLRCMLQDPLVILLYFEKKMEQFSLLRPILNYKFRMPTCLGRGWPVRYCYILFLNKYFLQKIPLNTS